MTDKPLYRWEVRRAAKERRRSHGGSVSTHDLIIIAVIMAMLVIVLRFVFIFGSITGMQIGPITTDVATMAYEPSTYVNLTSVNDSFRHLSTISLALGVYWAIVSWPIFASRTVGIGTKLFKLLLGVTIILLWFGSKLPEHALFFV